MAEGRPFSTSIQKLDDELTCPVCTEHFKEPKVLPCLHYYCKTCIADLIMRARGLCPECRREVPAVKDPDTFPTAFFINRMKELFSIMKKTDQKEKVECENCRSKLPSVAFCHQCSEYICTKCVEAHKHMRQFSTHEVVSIESLHTANMYGLPVVQKDVRCSKHRDEKLKLYCYECHKLVCRDCILIDHKDHVYKFVDDAAKQCKLNIKEKVKSVQKISVDLESAVKGLNDSEKQLSAHCTATMKAIDNAIDRIAFQLMQKKKQLKGETQRMVNKAKEEIKIQGKNAQLAVVEVGSLLEFMNRNLEKATDQEVLSLEKQMSDQVERVSQLYHNPAWKFPVPQIPQLQVCCSPRVEQVIESDIKAFEVFIFDEIEDERIFMLKRNQESTLQNVACRMQLTFRIDRNLNSIELKGSKESVAEMKSKVFEELNKADKDTSRKAQAMMTTVQWKRQDSTETEYDPLTNLEIEESYQVNHFSYTFKESASGEHFTIYFGKMEEVDHAARDQKCKVKRIDLEGEDGLPGDWGPMIDPKTKQEVPLRVVGLPVYSGSYQFALAEFHKTMTPGANYRAIVKIERIQNPALYRQYAAKKKQLESYKPKGVRNERWLFHGSKQSDVSKINKTNFNRWYHGQNGTVYGQGCYFARDASYSNRYSSPDGQGQKCMYLVRVLTGEYTQGANEMIVPPPKDPSDANVLYDSVVDNTANPTIVVVFFDAEAYPEFLITYK